MLALILHNVKELEGTLSTRRKGELERLILASLWANDSSMSVLEVRATFDEPVPATTTIITVLERLRAKGLVSRDKVGTDSYRYTTTSDHNEHVALAMASALAASSDRSLTLLNFTGQLSDEDKDVLRRMLDSRE
jgi:predicted transcriptional regulator